MMGGCNSEDEEVTVLHYYSRARLLELGSLSVCLLPPPQLCLEDAGHLSIVFPGMIGEDTKPPVPPSREKNVLDFNVEEIQGEDLEVLLNVLVNRVRSSQEEIEHMEKLCFTLKQIFSRDFPTVQVEPYGSFAR